MVHARAQWWQLVRRRHVAHGKAGLAGRAAVGQAQPGGEQPRCGDTARAAMAPAHSVLAPSIHAQGVPIISF